MGVLLCLRVKTLTRSEGEGGYINSTAVAVAHAM